MATAAHAVPRVDLTERVHRRVDELYTPYVVRIRLVKPLLGAVPKSAELIRPWLEAKTGFSDELTDVQEAETIEAIAADLESEEERMTSGFKMDDEGIYFEERCIHAMLREAATLAGLTVKKRGSKQNIREGTRIYPHRIRFEDQEGNILHLPDGTFEMTGTVLTPLGKRSIVTRHEYMDEGRELEFEIRVLDMQKGDGLLVDEEYLATCLAVGMNTGLGGRRSQDYGKFEVIRFERR